MNNEISVLSAPIYSLFSVQFYRRVLANKLSKGFLYLTFLSAIFAVVTIIAVNTRLIPLVEDFVDWAKEEMPVLVWSTQGLQMETQQSPYVMVHPEYGPLVTFNMDLEEGGLEHMGEVPILVTSQQIYVNEGNGQLRVYDVVPDDVRNQELPQSIRITGEAVENVYGNYKVPVIVLVVIASGIFMYLIKLLQGLLLSLLGLIINRSRKEALKYSQILNAAFFAGTAFFILEILSVLIPQAAVMANLLVNVLVTGLYLFLAIKKTEIATPSV